MTVFMATNNKIRTKDQQITLPLEDFIWDLMGDFDGTCFRTTITPLTATILTELLKDSLKWKVELFDEEGNELPMPVLWRYKDWEASNELYRRRKLYQHQERVRGWIEKANVHALAVAIRKATKMELDKAEPIAYKIIKTKNVELIRTMGLERLITKEGEL